MKKYLRTVLVVLLSGCIFSCANKDHVPGGVIGMKKMSNLLLDMQEAEVYSDSYMDTAYSLQSRDDKLKYFYAQILAIHDISKGKFLSSYHFYESHPDLLKEVYAKMQKEIDRKKDYADSLANVNEMRRLSVQRREGLIAKWNTYRLPFQQFTDSVPVMPKRVYKPVNNPWGLPEKDKLKPGRLIEEWDNYRLPFQRFTDSVPVIPKKIYRPVAIPTGLPEKDEKSDYRLKPR